MTWKWPVPLVRWAIVGGFCGMMFAASSGHCDEKVPAKKKSAKKAEPQAQGARKEKAKDKQKKVKDKQKRRTKKNPAAMNPLAKFIKKLFRPQPFMPGPAGGVPRNRHKKQASQPANGDVTARDHIDALAPHNPQQAKLLRRASAYVRDQNWKQAMEALQFLLELTEDSLVRLPNGKWVSVRNEANRMLGKFPQEFRERYRLQHGGIAKQLLQDAYEENDRNKFVVVATQFFQTEAGYQAANHLGSLHFDRGEFGMATRWFAELLQARAVVTNDPKWRLKAALAFQQAGNASVREDLLKELASTSLDGLELGGTRIDPSRWLDEVGSVSHFELPELEDWPVLYGSPSRTGTAVGGEPLLLPRWSHATTHSQSIREQMGFLLQDIADSGRATVGAWFPLMVDNKVIFRTMRGVLVVDATSGNPLWETREGISPERLLNGDPVGHLDPFSNQRAFAFAGNQRTQAYRGNNAEHHPLTSLLFRNGAYGILSSDGKQLFVLEDHALLSHQRPGYRWGWSPSVDPYRRSWSSNRLTSYDLKTGRPIWDVGGQAMYEPFDLPLAGNYFFGVPVADGGELFVVGEKNTEIRLFSLDAESGEPSWSQLIAYSDAKIEQDLGRRWWTSQIAVSNGVLVCPTTVGWLVAVDRSNRSVLWAHRYSKPSSRPRSHSSGPSLVPLSALNERWCPSAPIVVGNSVVYTPSEEPILICLNLFDGSLIWKRPKKKFLYLAGVFDDRVVLVGTKSVAAYSLEAGKPLWTLPIPSAHGRPSGMGVAVGNRYHLPLGSGQLWSIDLETGKAVSKSTLRDTKQRLGNLAMYRGMLLSLNASGLSSFEQRGALEKKIRDRKAQNSRDAWALLRETDVLLLKRNHSESLSTLRQIRPQELKDQDLPRYREAMIESLTATIRSNFQDQQREIEELAGFVSTVAEKRQYRRLIAERLDARQEYEAAFNLYRELARDNLDRTISRGDDPRITLRMDSWIAGKLIDLWSQMPEGLQAKLAGQIESAANKALTEDRSAQQRFVRLFGFHQAALPVRKKLVEAFAEAGELVRAENLLLKLSRHPNAEVAANAVERLARLLHEFGLKRDADYHYILLLQRFPDTKLAGGKTARQLVEQLQTAGTIGSSDVEPHTWGNVDLKVVRSGASYSYDRVRELKSGPFRMPYFQDHRFLVYQQHQRLAVVGAADESLDWLLPLRRTARSHQGNYVTARATAHQLLILHYDVLHSVSPAERKVLWTRPLETRGHASGYYRSPSDHSAQPMKVGTRVLSRTSLAQQAAHSGMLAVSNSEYVCVYGRRRFRVLDAMTGEVRWTCENVPPHTVLHGNENVIYMIPQDRRKAVALRALDGKKLNLKNVAKLLAKSIHISPNGLVLVKSASRRNLLGIRTSKKTLVRLFDPVGRKEHWKIEFPKGTRFSLLEDGYLVAFKQSIGLKLVDLQNGKSRQIGEAFSKSDLKSKSELFAIADQHNLYFIVNRRDRESYYYSDGIAPLHVNGLVFAFDRKTGRQLWKQKVENQNLVRQQFNHSPMLVFAARKYVQKPFAYSTLSLLVLDKQTGRRLVERTDPSDSYSDYHNLSLNMDERYIELRSYNQRIRFIATDRQTAVAK